MSKARGLADLGNVYDDGALSNRNLLINSAMQVAQRGVGPEAGQDGYYTIDRFRVEAGSTGTSIETSQSTEAPTGFKNSFKYQIKSPNSTVLNSSVVSYSVEGHDMAHLEWGTSDAKSVTLSFYVKCSKTLSSLGGSITNETFDMTYPFDYGISAADTWEHKVITIAGPTSGTWASTGGKGLKINFNLGSASGRLAAVDTWADTVARGPTGADNITQTDEATWQITGVQLEVGDGPATPFEHRLYSDELQRCMRYYEQIEYSAYSAVAICHAYNTTSLHGPFYYNEKRVIPTIAVNNGVMCYNNATAQVPTSLGFGSPTKRSVNINPNNGMTFTANAASFVIAGPSGFSLKLDAEL